MWFTENVEPAFTQEDKDIYNTFGVQQEMPVGNIVNGRQLIRGLYNESVLPTVIQFLKGKGKDPIICGYVKNEAEFNKHFTADEEGFVPPSNTAAGWLTMDYLLS